MGADPLHALLELEDDFFQEGFEAGIADATYAGMVEGKIFGIEKGYEKAAELARLRGRALVWDLRLKLSEASATEARFEAEHPLHSFLHTGVASQLNHLPPNARLQKHVESLLSLTNNSQMSLANTDQAVAEFDDRIAKARTKFKVIANITREAASPVASGNSGIEDTTGLNARH